MARPELVKPYLPGPVPHRLKVLKEDFSPLNYTIATFLKLAGPQLVQMFIGDGAKLVRDAFK